MGQRLTQRFPNKEMVRESVAHNQGLMYVVVALFFVCLFVFCGIQLFVFQLLSRVEFFMTSWTALCRVPLSFTISQNLLRFMSTESLMLSNHLILCLSLLLLPSIFLSMRVFPMCPLFESGGQSIGASVSTLVLPMNTSKIELLISFL